MITKFSISVKFDNPEPADRIYYLISTISQLIYLIFRGNNHSFEFVTGDAEDETKSDISADRGYKGSEGTN